jgi:hypothetical protein
MSLSTNRLKSKLDVVLVERATRGKFPGPKAKKETIGLVWSSWLSHPQWRTEKLSLLTTQGEVCFTTRSCISKIGTFEDFEDVKSAYEKYVEENFIPIFCMPVRTVGLDVPRSRNWELSWPIKILGFSKIYFIYSANIAKKDLDYMLKNPDDPVFSIRIEPWILEKFKII